MSRIDLLSAGCILGGALLIGAGIWQLRAGCPRGYGTAENRGGSNGRTRSGQGHASSGFSVPARLSLAVVSLVVGYHLVAWGVPAAWGTPVAFPRQWWFAVVAVGAAWAGLSVLLDRLENRPRS